MSDNPPISIKSRAGSLRLLVWTIVPVLMLAVPLLAMQMTDEVQWVLGDFAVGGALLAAAGLTYGWLTQSPRGRSFRLIWGVVIFGILAFIWAELAVGVFT